MQFLTAKPAEFFDFVIPAKVGIHFLLFYPASVLSAFPVVNKGSC